MLQKLNLLFSSANNDKDLPLDSFLCKPTNITDFRAGLRLLPKSTQAMVEIIHAHQAMVQGIYFYDYQEWRKKAIKGQSPKNNPWSTIDQHYINMLKISRLKETAPDNPLPVRFTAEISSKTNGPERYSVEGQLSGVDNFVIDTTPQTFKDLIEPVLVASRLVLKLTEPRIVPDNKLNAEVAGFDDALGAIIVCARGLTKLPALQVMSVTEDAMNLPNTPNLDRRLVLLDNIV